MKKRVLQIIVVLALTISSAEAGEIGWEFTFDSLQISSEAHKYSYSQLPQLNVNGNLTLPVKTVYLLTDRALLPSDFLIQPRDRLVIGQIPQADLLFDNKITGLDEKHKESPLHVQSRLMNNVYEIQKIVVGNRPCLAVSLLPVVIDSANNIIFVKQISLKTDEYIETFEGKDDVVCAIEENRNILNKIALPKVITAGGLPLGYEYTIVTTSALADNFIPLANFKNGCGLSTVIALSDSIYAHYSGIDKAEQIRNYLKDVYHSGGRYILIGGDDSLMPVRYLCYYNTSYSPDISDLMPSDLYYADLDGTWDKDADGVWGEPTDDAPDMIPDLKVGRLPVRTPEAVRKYVAKLLTYYTNPGNGDYDYLTKSLFFCSDEMRDYPTGGQHNFIAAASPADIAIDTFTTVEMPTGDALTPTNPDGAYGINKISEGFGIINIIAHGRTDGFIVKSANYGDWPASFILTAPQTGANGGIPALQKNNKTSFYYSLSCNVGGYDLDSVGGVSTDYSFVERLISADSSGAVGIVAYSRWGWVYSSYLLQQSFMKYLYGAADGNPVDAMNLSWLDYPFFRDLIYGQNYFGDPSLQIYRAVPQRMELSVTKAGTDDYIIEALDDSDAATGAIITISNDGSIMRQGTTDESGRWTFEAAFNYDSTYVIMGMKEGYAIAHKSYSPSLAAGTDDENNLAPKSFSLGQNYPNPFNPATTISYALPLKSDVTLAVYDILGRLIDRIDISGQSAGAHTIEWDITTRKNRELASGIYFYQLRAENYCQTKKMMLIK